MAWAELIKILGAVVGGVIEQAGAGARRANPDDAHARRAEDAGRAIREIFSGKGPESNQERRT